MLDIKQN